MKKITIVFLFLAFAFVTQGQVRYWIFFTDKPLAAEKMEFPQKYLSQKAIDRRTNQGIALNSTDVPVHAAYIAQIKASGITVLQKSKWLNGISVLATKAQITAIKELPFVREVAPVLKLKKQQVEVTESITTTFATTSSVLNYGPGANQIFMMAGQYLHGNNNRGQGMLIAQLDGGFEGVNTHPAFDSLWARNGILTTYDFIDNDTDIFHGGTHGMSVLSVMTGYVDGQLVGSAPGATFVLLKSENEASETTIEEDNWVAAAEFADSVGADIISSSLGYNLFNNGLGNYTWDDLDGRTATTSKAAVLAARKGILVVNSAGNEGASAWQKIITPADADSILTVGGVDSKRQHVGFSSVGPTADGRIKPDVSAQAGAVTLALSGGNVGTGNGTSFAAPLVSGLAACLWQRHPNATAMQIRDAIKKSSDRYDMPDNEYGYGIPDFYVADYILSNPEATVPEPLEDIMFFPNPFTDKLTLFMRVENYPLQADVNVFDAKGNTVGSKKIDVYSKFTDISGFENLAAGAYFFEVVYNGKSTKVKMLR